MPRKIKNFSPLGLIVAISLAPLNSFALDREFCLAIQNKSLMFLGLVMTAEEFAKEVNDEEYEEVISLSYENLELAADWASIYTAFCKE